MYGGSSLQMPEVNSDCPPLVGVAVLVWSFSIGGCRHSRCYLCRDDRSQQRLSVALDGSSLLSAVPYGSSLQMTEVNSDCFPLMGVAILGVILH